jgi:hypothetical protein
MGRFWLATLRYRQEMNRFEVVGKICVLFCVAIAK